MEYQKIINTYDDATNQLSKFRTRIWAEIIESKGKYSNSNLRFKISMIGSILCDYKNAYIPVNKTIAVLNKAS